MYSCNFLRAFFSPSLPLLSIVGRREPAQSLPRASKLPVPPSTRPSVQGTLSIVGKIRKTSLSLWDQGQSLQLWLPVLGLIHLQFVADMQLLFSRNLLREKVLSLATERTLQSVRLPRAWEFWRVPGCLLHNGSALQKKGKMQKIPNRET